MKHRITRILFQHNMNNRDMLYYKLHNKLFTNNNFITITKRLAFKMMIVGTIRATELLYQLVFRIRRGVWKFELSVNTDAIKAVAIQNIPCCSPLSLYCALYRYPLIDNCVTKITLCEMTS